MMHANRRAERAEQALIKEVRARHDDQVTATTLFCTYKDTINALELTITQAQRCGPSKEQFQALQAANDSLEAAIAEQRDRAVQLRKNAEETIRGLHAKIDAEELRIRTETARHYEERLTQAKKQLSEEFSQEVQAEAVPIRKLYQECKAENESLKQKLKQATHMLDWNRKCTQQKAAERVYLHSQSTSAFPPRQSPVPVKKTVNKRRKLDHVGNADMVTPDGQRGCRNLTKPYTSASTPKRRVQDASMKLEEPSLQLLTPTRQHMMPRQQKHSGLHTSPLQQSHQPQKQPPSLPPHLQDIPQAQQLFSSFIQQLNAQRVNNGHTELNPEEGLLVFNKWVAQRLSQQVPTLLSNNTAFQPVLQHSKFSPQPFDRKEDSMKGPEFPFLSLDTPPDPQTLTPLNTVSPSSDQNTALTQMQQSYPTNGQQQKQQQRCKYSQSMLSSPSMLGQGLSNTPPALPIGYNATSLVTFSNDTDLNYAAQLRVASAVEDMYFASQITAQPGDVGIYPSPEDPERAQDTDGVTVPANPPSWGSPASKDGDSVSDISNTQLALDDFDSRVFGSDFGFRGYPITTGTPLPPFMQTNQQNSNYRIKQQNHFVYPQQFTGSQAINPALLFNDQAHFPVGSFIDKPSSYDACSPPLQRSKNEKPTPSHQNLSQDSPRYPPVSRKRSVTPLSNRSTPALSTRSTPAPAGPPLAVCLHCHGSWWNDSCDAAEPCQNCISSGKACQRPRCIDFTRGACNTLRCPRVHEGDMRYKNVVIKPKTLKRIGKRSEQKPSPSLLAYQQG
ncbi:uncharacterized protein EKO05_0007704 [Ascochyta rabiei]|uniref:uncharacterized protein n=1 Tax=Didymella rabiei TaxID=5454 RepID=UPI00220212C5|nr:uncharacterized protein EKO05_0007704 [Ascochyta rabiei]UPX17342.1 hypothetical protein EKO05_0007704 [Ascochyta rabiei]